MLVDEIDNGDIIVIMSENYRDYLHQSSRDPDLKFEGSLAEIADEILSGITVRYIGRQAAPTEMSTYGISDEDAAAYMRVPLGTSLMLEDGEIKPMNPTIIESDKGTEKG